MNQMNKLTLCSIAIALLFSITDAADSIIQQTCKSSSDKNRNINLDFCVRSLQAVPSSASADLFQLGSISIELIQKNVIGNSKMIEDLLKNPKDKDSSAALEDCKSQYSDAGETVSEAAEAYKKKGYGDANIKLSSVMDAATSCEDGLKEKGSGASPLTKQNADVFQLTAIALSIMNMNP